MRLRNLAAGLALLVTGTVIGVTTQQFASADISTGDRPVLVPIESCRLLDTRPDFNVGPRATPLGPGETYNVDTQQADTECTGNIPTEATALAINLTALNATENGFITTWAEGNRPNGSTLNPAPGQLVFNAATVQLANDNTFQIYNENGTVDIIIDVIGYYENHNHDDRYVQLDDHLDLSYLIANSTGTSLRASTPDLADTVIFRPPSEATGIYCLVFPDDAGVDRNGIMATIEDGVGGDQHYGIAVNTTINTACSEDGAQWDATVTITSSAGGGAVTLVNSTFRLLVPTRS